MKRLFALFLCAFLPAAEYKQALPGYVFRFPQDHFSHPGFQTEWWYYTGNVRTKEGRRFGFELTFFRHNLRQQKRSASPWAIDDLYLAHLALTDLEGGKFQHWERVNRAGPGLAGVDAATQRIWNGNWEVILTPSQHTLRAVTQEHAMTLTMTPVKPPVVQGVDGVSQKADGVGQASHYVSFPRLSVIGDIVVQNRHFEVSGIAWMDHEFFTNSLGSGQVGWDWFYTQLENGEELMLYRIRRKDGQGDVSSSGTFVDREGRARHLTSKDFTLTPTGACWKSPSTGACYPLKWEIAVPSLQLQLTSESAMQNQELVSKTGLSPVYWEGVTGYAGLVHGAPVRGTGYVELTGYYEPFQFNPANPK